MSREKEGKEREGGRRVGRRGGQAGREGGGERRGRGRRPNLSLPVEHFPTSPMPVRLSELEHFPV